jgi:hypothetical protein
MFKIFIALTRRKKAEKGGNKAGTREKGGDRKL